MWWLTTWYEKQTIWGELSGVYLKYQLLPLKGDACQKKAQESEQPLDIDSNLNFVTWLMYFGKITFILLGSFLLGEVDPGGLSNLDESWP